jgi:crossover junction endodeoxyribonuclease RuvC
MNYVIGVDPGMGGALSLLSLDHKLIDVIDMPCCPKSATKNWVDANKLNIVIKGWLEIVDGDFLEAGVENVHAMPGNGVSAMFSFGHALGIVHAALVCNGIPIHWITPQSWKKHYNMTSEKKVATAKACNLYPQHTDLLVTPRGKCLDGRAEAILIARYLQVKNG